MIRPIRLAMLGVAVLVVLVASPAWAGATISLDNETPRGLYYALDLAAGSPRVTVSGFARAEGASLPAGTSIELAGPSGTWTLSGAGGLSDVSVALAEGERAELVLVAKEVQGVAFVELRLQRDGALVSSEIVYLPDSPPAVPIGEEERDEGDEPTLEQLQARKDALQEDVERNELLAEIALLEARLARLEGYAHLYVPAPGTYAYGAGSPNGSFRVSYYGYGGSSGWYGGPYVCYGWPYLYSGPYFYGGSCYAGPGYGCYGGGVGLYYHTGNFYFAAGTSHCFR